jgi:hypothetical protein
MQMEELRDQFGSEWFLHRKGNEVLGLSFVENTSINFGDADRKLKLSTYEGLDFARARLDAALPALLPAYEPQRVRPFQFLAQKSEFVSAITSEWAVPSAVRAFSIRPRFQLEAKTIELAENRLQVVVTLDVGMQWNIDASLRELHRLKVPLDGLYVIRRDVLQGERRLVGRIGRVTGETVELSESFGEATSVPIDEIRLEGSKTNFKRCRVFS